MLGTTIGSYQVRAKIGEGGMGAVYIAEHTTLGRRAAIKVLLPEMSGDRGIVMRFFNEARAASAIKHPSIVEIYDFGYTPEGSAYIVMEFLEGESLASRRARLGRIDVRTAMVFVRQIARGLAAAHELSIVHRDLKPDNIYLVVDPEVQGGERIKLLDFGIAKLQKSMDDTSRTQTGSVLGTPTYMAPEQCRGSGSVDARADLYALGCVLYELLCGRPPFVAEGAGELLAHHLYFEPAPPRQLDPTLPEPVERIVMWLLRKDPSQRPQTARELVQAIDRIGIGTGDYAPPPSHASGPVATVSAPTTLTAAAGIKTPTAITPRKRWVIPAIAATAIAGGIAVFVVASSGKSLPESHAAVETPAPAPAPAPAPPPAPVVQPPPPPAPPPAAAVPTSVKLAIDSDPPGATVQLAGKTVGTTPFVDTADHGSAKRVYTLEKDGYDNATATLETDRDATQKIVLKKKHHAVTKPPATPGLGDKGVNPFDQ